MSRGLRFVPEGGALVEVTLRTIQSRLLLRPSPAVNEIILGVLGRAQRLYGAPRRRPRLRGSVTTLRTRSRRAWSIG
jgi:hypothetical protein